MVDTKPATKYLVQTYSVKIVVFSNQLKQAWMLELNLMEDPASKNTKVKTK